MAWLKSRTTYFLLLTACLLCGSAAKRTMSAPAALTLMGSTPGDDLIKSQLALPAAAKVDFIRWRLELTEAEKKTFMLHLVFGESQPNTLGFIGGGEKRMISGTYTLTPIRIGPAMQEVYLLKAPQLPAGLSLVKLNNDLFHLLTPQNKLMNGNGGWSYSLNRQQQLAKPAADLPATLDPAGLARDTARQIIFDGRTPCQDLARENNLAVAPDCFKLKWRIILNRDPKTLQPTTYQLLSTTNRRQTATGRWTIVRGARSNPGAILYRLTPDKPGPVLTLLAGDANVLFFLDQENRLLVGNYDFSYTLNKKVPQ